MESFCVSHRGLGKRNSILFLSLASYTRLAGGSLSRFNPQSVSHLYHGTFEAGQLYRRKRTTYLLVQDAQGHGVSTGLPSDDFRGHGTG